LLSPRGEQYARKLPDIVRESVGVSYELVRTRFMINNETRMTDH
jgi:hypothetical protein